MFEDVADARRVAARIRRSIDEHSLQRRWKDFANSAEASFRKACGNSIAEAILDEDPWVAGSEEHPFGSGGLPCVAFGSHGVIAASKSFLELSCQPMKAIQGLNLQEVPLHSANPKELHILLNEEAWKALHQFHITMFSQHEAEHRPTNHFKSAHVAMKAVPTIHSTKRDKMKAFRSIATTNFQPSQPPDFRHVISLLVSSRPDGSLFFNLIQAFHVVCACKSCIVHVLMPMHATVPRIFKSGGHFESNAIRTVLGHARSPLSNLLQTQFERDFLMKQLDDGYYERSDDRTLQVVKVAVESCNLIAHQLSDEEAYVGPHFAPQLGTVLNLSFKQLKKWETILDSGFQEHISEWRVNEPLHHEGSLLPYLIMDPDEADCPLVFVSKGLEDLFGKLRCYVLGRNFRCIQLLDSVKNRAFNASEFVRLDDFCQTQSDGHMLSLILLNQAMQSHPTWHLLYLQHAWLPDPHSYHSKYDHAEKHFVVGWFTDVTAQQAALNDMLPWDDTELSSQHLGRLRIMLQENFSNPSITKRSPQEMIDEVVPEWLFDNARSVKTSTAGCHFVPRVGLAQMRKFEGKWPSLFEVVSRSAAAQWLDANLELLEHTRNDDHRGIACAVSDPSAEDDPVIFVSKSLRTLIADDDGWSLARNIRHLRPRMARIDAAINGDESQIIDEFCKEVQKEGSRKVSCVLCENRKGERFWAVWVMMHVNHAQTNTPLVLTVVKSIETKMAGALQTDQVSKLQEEESGLVVDEWGAFTAQLREDLVTYIGTRNWTLTQVAAFLANKIDANMKIGEDYKGDHFVPRNGLVELHAFRETGAFKHVLAAMLEDGKRLLEMPHWDGKDDDISLAIADPSGKDFPLVYMSQGFEDLTGYQREWALGRNERFLQPARSEQNRLFNGEQLERLGAFYRSARSAEAMLDSMTFSLLVNEKRNGLPYWGLTCHLRVKALGKPYIVSLSVPLLEERARLAEVLCLDPEATLQLERIKSLLSRHQGGVRFTSFKVVSQQLISAWTAAYPPVLQAPALRSSGFGARGNCLEMSKQLSMFGLEVLTDNMQAMEDALRTGIRHLHLVLPFDGQSKTADAIAFTRKLIPLKLAEILNRLQKLNLHYLREAFVFTLRTPPQLMPVLIEVRKTLATHGYNSLCWLLDVRGCSPSETADHWHTLSINRHPGEALGLYCAGARLLSAAESVKGGAPVSIYATEMHPGRRPDEAEVRLISKMRSKGIIPMACNVFGPQNNWVRSQEAKIAAAKVNLDPRMLALKWAEHKGFAAVTPQILEIGLKNDHQKVEQPLMHRSFVRAYQAAPSAEACASALSGEFSASSMQKRRTINQSPAAASPLADRGISQKVQSARSVSKPATPRVVLPMTLEFLRTPRKRIEEVHAHLQALPDVYRRASTAPSSFNADRKSVV